MTLKIYTCKCSLFNTHTCKKSVCIMVCVCVCVCVGCGLLREREGAENKCVCV